MAKNKKRQQKADKRKPDCQFYSECLNQYALLNKTFSCGGCERYQEDKEYALRDLYGYQEYSESEMDLKRLRKDFFSC